VTGRKPRADAAVNRAAVLAAAQDAFAACGPDVALDEIARRANVGPGTVHRHFPSKQALIGAVVLDRLTGLADVAGRLAEAADPGAAFTGFLRQLAGEAAHNRVLSLALGTDLGEEVAAATATLRQRVAVLLGRAQRAGAVRADLDPADLHALIIGIIEAERRLPDSRRGLGVDVLCDGLRERGSARVAKAAGRG